MFYVALACGSGVMGVGEQELFVSSLQILRKFKLETDWRNVFHGATARITDSPLLPSALPPRLFRIQIFSIFIFALLYKGFL